MRIVRTASGAVSVGEYARAWARIRAAPAGTSFRSGLTHWGPATREELLRDFSVGLHDRINRRVPGYGEGRRWSDDYEDAARRVARALAARVRVHGRDVPADLRARLAHRLSDDP